MDMTKWLIRVAAIGIILISTVRGLYLVNTYSGGNESIGVAMLRLMYEYDSIEDVYDREDEIRSRCTDEVWKQINFDNQGHWDGAWERTKNAPTRIRVLRTYPGLIVYAIESEFVHPAYLWCFEYTLDHGKFSSIREYQIVGLRESTDGGFF